MLFAMEKPSEELSPEDLEQQWNENKAIFTASQDTDRIFRPGTAISAKGEAGRVSNPFGFDFDQRPQGETELSSDDAGEHKISK